MAATDDKRPAFGNRQLTDPSKVFEHNAWDKAEWTEEMEQEAKEQVSKNSEQRVSEEERIRLEEEAAANWDLFYQRHEDRFFKDRNWLAVEFPELMTPPSDADSFRVLEVGCGVGNTIFPLLDALKQHEKAFVFGSDFSQTAINIVRESPRYDSSRCLAFVHDVSRIEEQPLPLDKASLDVISLIHVLSAIEPRDHPVIVRGLSAYLRPGGCILFRDYGRYDLAQLRIKQGNCLAENFYRRQDGTRTYFFDETDVRSLFCGAGLVEKLVLSDRRLNVNRGKRLVMRRVTLMAKFCKP